MLARMADTLHLSCRLPARSWKSPRHSNRICDAIGNFAGTVHVMSITRTRDFLLSLPRVEETVQWDSLVYWVLDKAVGGKMFAVMVPEPDGRQVIAFAAPPEQFADMLEREGVRPAPYLARAQWVAVERWDVFTAGEWQTHLQAAYHRVGAKLPPRVQRLMDLKQSEYRTLVREKRAAAKAAARK
jgi:predicted DNA-binding protein (MmcQ/YjbR family)